MKAVQIRARAEIELYAAVDWYDQQRPGLGEAFETAFEACLLRASEFPASYPMVDPPLRRMLIGRYPYLAYYRETDDAIVVAAILHGAIDPQSISDRLRKEK